MENPTESVDVSFQNYVEARQRIVSAHMQGSVPDYSFSMDYALRNKINAIPGIYKLFKAVTESYVPYQKQYLNLNCVAVGADQYPHLYKIAEDCARRLGIGVPQIYIENDITQINAAAYAMEDGAPLIVVTTAIVERFSDEELKAVIGHECGHVHNNHAIYSIIADMLSGSISLGVNVIPGLSKLLALFSFGSQVPRILFNNWSRCAEVTADRAGMICSDDPEIALRATAKLAFSGSKALENINLDAFIRQIDKTRDSIARFNEYLYDHPITAKRVLADKLFMECDVLYSWRPEWKKPDMETRGKAETDKECESFISVATKKKRGVRE